MKRHPALVPLSRDHHHTLVIAQRLRRATHQNAAEAVSAFLDHWDAEQRRHFRLEEELLLPALAAQGALERPEIVRMLLDHAMIRMQAVRLEQDPALGLAHALGERLAEHVRLEENEVFPLIEATLPESQLVGLAEQLAEAPERT